MWTKGGNPKVLCGPLEPGWVCKKCQADNYSCRICCRKCDVKPWGSIIEKAKAADKEFHKKRDKKEERLQKRNGEMRD